VMTAPLRRTAALDPYSQCVPDSPTAVTQSDDPNPPTPPGLRRGAVIALAIAMVVALGVIAVAAVRKANEDAPQVPRNSNITPHNTATINPAARSDTEAAVRYGWQLQDHDEFDGHALGPAWRPYSGETTGGVGRHDPANLHVADGTLSIVSHGLSSGGLEWTDGQLYGRWEVRARTERATGYGDVLILWPDAEDFPRGGEVDFMEIPKPERTEYNFNLHFGADNSQNGTKVAGDFTQWHNYAVEWMPDHVAGFVDGQEVFRTTERHQIPPRPMHLAIQQDIGPYDDWIPPRDASTPPEVHFDIDWVRIYRA
jgi:beta-glucanase (GH16 family)